MSTAARTSDDVLADLRANTDRLAYHDFEAETLRQTRWDLWQEARALEPPVTTKVIAEASALSEPMVIKTLKRDRPEVRRAPADRPPE